MDNMTSGVDGWAAGIIGAVCGAALAVVAMLIVVNALKVA